MKSLQMNALDILCENALQILMHVIGAVITGMVLWWLAIIYIA